LTETRLVVLPDLITPLQASISLQKIFNWKVRKFGKELGLVESVSGVGIRLGHKTLVTEEYFPRLPVSTELREPFSEEIDDRAA
jgi:hypothetical protein